MIKKQIPAIFFHLSVPNAHKDLNFKDIRTFPFTFDDLKELCPLVVFDVSKQHKRLKNLKIVIRTWASFKEGIPVESEWYFHVLIYSDKLITLESDQNKMFVAILYLKKYFQFFLIKIVHVY